MRLPTACAKLSDAAIAALFWKPPEPMNTATECGPWVSMIRRSSAATMGKRPSGIGVSDKHACVIAHEAVMQAIFRNCANPAARDPSCRI